MLGMPGWLRAAEQPGGGRRLPIWVSTGSVTGLDLGDRGYYYSLPTVRAGTTPVHACLLILTLLSFFAWPDPACP